MKLPDEIMRFFPSRLQESIQSCAKRTNNPIEEIRCRIGQPCSVLSAGTEVSTGTEQVKPEDLDYILERATAFSYHAYADELRQGYIHTDSGCRIGVCGTIFSGGLRDVSSVSIRIANAAMDCAKPALPELLSGGLASTLILSPPGVGKTTFLRDLIRLMSVRGYRISVADQRGELAAMHHRTPQFDLGPHTDVMSAGSKHDACMMMLRAMNPQILALDEITAEEDVEAVMYAAGCGVALFATAHSANASALERRPLYRNLLREQIFKRAVEIQLADGQRHYRVVSL